MAIDVETAIPLLTTISGNDQISIRTLPGRLMASAIHIGDALFIGLAHAAMYRWMKNNGYHLIDTPRLVRLQRSEDMDPGQYVTEVQFPVKLQAKSETIV